MLSPTKTLFGIALCLGTAACGSDAPMNIGDVGVTGEKLSDYAGTWEGYAEASQFVDGSDHVRIMLDTTGEGVIEVGGGTARAYPVLVEEPGAFPFDLGHNEVSSAQIGPFLDSPAPGYSYPLYGATIESGRIRFSVDLTPPYKDWCASFTPILDTVHFTPEGPEYYCIKSGAQSVSEDGVCSIRGEAVECDDFMCWSTCQCDADHCSVRTLGAYETSDTRFDGVLEDEGEALVGTLVVGEHMTVRLTRQ